ncbi:hypothetical protein D2E26_0859 [Bifidobacterium dolichotidis]|uniref:Zn-finger containing protein n=1 Tax=Bifidobacterium dolichotidis TaxID=2306976 RepID=A0A430FPR4_9BIFI|nr:DUF6320 domain-containing protein [Bifidobacterium dolichotidis]RSX54805.1 hypothetical protein D2E26_0859 [Bifidobacterium dolichotidis]
MRRCQACDVDYTGHIERCPLCQSDLVGEAVPGVLPRQIPMLKPRKLLIETLMFATIVCIVAIVFFAYLFQWPWADVIAALISFCIMMMLVTNTVAHSVRPLRLFFRLPFFVVLASLVWLLFTPNSIITEFVLPITSLASFAYDVVILIILRDKAIDRYFKYLIFDIILAGLMTIMIPLGWTPWHLLVLINTAVAIIMLFSLIIFAHRQIADNMHRQFSA